MRSSWREIGPAVCAEAERLFQLQGTSLELAGQPGRLKKKKKKSKMDRKSKEMKRK